MTKINSGVRLMFTNLLFLLIFLITPAIAFSEPVKRQLQTEMLEAAKKGDWEALNTAIANGADSHGRTLLHWAAGEGYADDVNRFIQQGADIEAKDKSGWTPLALAAFAGKIDTVKLLLEKGANLKVKDNVSDTPLHLVATAGFKEVANILIENGADLEAKNYKGETPLFAAVTNYRKPTFVSFLLVEDANMEVRNQQGKTPLNIATERKQEALDMAEAEQPTPEWLLERVEGYKEIVNILQQHKNK